MKNIAIFGLTLSVILGLFWLQKNKTFYGHLDPGDTDVKILYDSPTAVKIYDLSIFGQFPANVPDVCQELFGCDENCTIVDTCASTEACIINGGIPSCTLNGSVCVKACSIAIFQVRNYSI